MNFFFEFFFTKNGCFMHVLCVIRNLKGGKNLGQGSFRVKTCQDGAGASESALQGRPSHARLGEQTAHAESRGTQE